MDNGKDAFVGKLLEQLLDGNKGSNLLGAILAAMMATNIDYAKAIAGFRFDSMDNATESVKLIGTVVLAIFAWFVGKKKPAV